MAGELLVQFRLRRPFAPVRVPRHGRQAGQGRRQVAANLLDLAERGVHALQAVADALVGGGADLRHLVHDVGPEGRHLAFRSGQDILAGGSRPVEQAHPRLPKLVANGHGYATGRHSCGAEEEDSLYCHPGRRRQKGATQGHPGYIPISFDGASNYKAVR